MSDKCIMSTKGISDRQYNIGDIVYAKKNKKTNEVCFYEKNGIVGEDMIGKYIETKRGEKRFVDKFNMPLNKRKAYIVYGKEDDNFLLEYIYQEDDIIDEEVKYLYKDFIYKIENGRIIISGFHSNKVKIEIPDNIDGKEVYAIGNVTNAGICIPLEMPSDRTFNIILPDTIKEIYSFAFMNKSVSMNFPSSLYYIGTKAFYGARIDHIDLSITKLDTIERECFEYSTIESIKLPSTLNRINRESFKYSNLKAVEFNSDLSVIEEEAFYDCNIDTNRARVDRVEFNAFTCATPIIEKESECISYDDIKYKIFGRLKFEDYIKDKILEKEYIDAYCNCMKQVFFAIDTNTADKYEILIEVDEEYGNNDEWLEYLKYINSVRITLWRVKEFNIERHFETYIPEYDDIRISGRIEEGQISVKTEDGKIVGIKLSERYRYNYEEFVYSEFNSGEFGETNPYLALSIVFNEPEDTFIYSKEEEERYKTVKERYNNFCGLSTKVVE